MLAWSIYFISRRSATANATSFIEFAFPSRLYRHRSTALDARFMAVDLIASFLLYLPIYAGIGLLGTKVMSALIMGLFSWEPPQTLSPTVVIGTALGFTLFYDLVTYWSHRWFHQSPLLWSFHQVHHSAEVLTPAAAYRVHPVENIAFTILQAPTIGMIAVMYHNIVGPDRQFIMIGGVTVVGFVLQSLGSHLRHSHIWWSFGPWLNRLLISPAHHQFHHSIEARHWNRNFGEKFAIWDVLFGTLYLPCKPETLRVGLPEIGYRGFATVWQLYFLPFKLVARGCLERISPYLRSRLAQGRLP
jgi:sterol desaturase/sphingolipid hydroxylase (fatty acid hydroxylase superfamily)